MEDQGGGEGCRDSVGEVVHVKQAGDLGIEGVAQARSGTLAGGGVV